jgi:hypothetical protein
LRAEYGSGFAWLADGTRLRLSLTAGLDRICND